MAFLKVKIRAERDREFPEKSGSGIFDAIKPGQKQQNRELPGKNREFPIRDRDLTKIGKKFKKKFLLKIPKNKTPKPPNPLKTPQTSKEFSGPGPGCVLP